MQLLLRVLRPARSGARDVAVELDPAHTVGELAVALGRYLRTDSEGLSATRLGRLDPGATIAESGLLGGDEVSLTAQPATPAVAFDDACTIAVGVLSGPDAGTWWALGAGSYTIGRAPSCDLVLADPSVSRVHTRLTIDDTSHARDGEVLTVGCSRLVIGSITTTARGEVDFHRTPPRPLPTVPAGVERIGPIPDEPEPRRLPLVAMIAPLAAGLTMFTFSRQPQFLVLTLLTPIVMLATAIDDRRGGRRRARRTAQHFTVALDTRLGELEARLAHERTVRRAAAPALVDLARRAAWRTLDLWSRAAGAPDFLAVRLGLGDDRAAFTLELAAGGAQALRDQAVARLAGLTDLHQVPVVAGLRGSVIAIHGERGAVTDLAASIVLQAACLHPPGDLAIATALRDPRRMDWVKWLPHAHPLDAVRGPALLVADGDAHALDSVPAAGGAVVWLASSAADVPRQARYVIETSTATATLWSTDPASSPRQFLPEPIGPARATVVARTLAPVRDVSPASDAAVPALAGLDEVLGCPAPEVEWVVRRWDRAPAGLRAAIGVGAGGVVEIDLVADGPHTLIAGTSGAGKSELLQSIVVALASAHPPSRLNFLFVDYKGGAATSGFDRLPHTVGQVTNLDATLTARALTSLRAELERRMRLLDGCAKDLTGLLAIDPDAAPAALVIVVDEFATLARELPEFVTGVIDIAQRGRSLGIHLVLATQRPAGAVSEQILANTNLRIALRTLDAADSTSVIGVPDAASIPAASKGRAIVRAGTDPPRVFQSAYGSSAVTGDASPAPIRVADLLRPGDRPEPVGDDAVGESQLGRLLTVIAAAAARLALPPPLRPWLPPLPGVLRFDPEQGAVGVIDLPRRQQQCPLEFEPGAGGWLIFGAGGSGKTSALRTIAAAIATPTAPGGRQTCDVIGFDLGDGGLATLAALPGVVAVAGGDDLEALSRQVLVIERELAGRRRQRAAGSPVVILIDGFGELAGVLGDHWSERLVTALVDGRRFGIQAVITADRKQAVPARLQAAIPQRLILCQAEPAAFADHGITAARGAALQSRPGRGWWLGESLVQLAVTGGPGETQQRAAVTALAAPSEHRRSSPLASAALPDCVLSTELGSRAAIGVADVTGEPVVLDLDHSHLLVVGPPRSGRSTALAMIAAAFAHTNEVCVFDPADPDPPLPATAVLLVDGLDRLDPRLSVWERVACDADVRVVASVDTHTLGSIGNPLLAALRARRMLVLQPDDPVELLQLTGVRQPMRPGLSMPPGRGVLVVDRHPRVIQVAVPPLSRAGSAGVARHR